MIFSPVAAVGSIFAYLFVILMANATVVLQLIGSWFAFRKMQLPGWKGIIPYYSTYVLFDKLWDTKKFWRFIIYMCVFLGAFLFGYFFILIGIAIGASNGISAGAVILVIVGVLSVIASFVMIVLSLVIEFQLYKRMAAAFGLQNGWAWGLLFVPYIMLPIIGFHKNIQYYGPMNQV